MTAPAAATDHADGTRTYEVPDPRTGEIVSLPNITGIIAVLAPKHIADWELKMVLLGAAMREDLQTQTAAGHLLPVGPPRNAELRRMIELAKTAGQIIEKGHIPSDRGTGLHSLSERLDELVPPGQVSAVDELGLPRRMGEIARAYVDAMAGVEIVHTEVTVANLTHRYAGTADRFIRFRPLDAWATVFDQYDLGRGTFVFDNKFGAKVDESVAMQLAAIVMGETLWDAEAGTHTPLPADLRRDVGFVFNPDQGLIPVDLTGAGDAFLGALAVKHHQDRGLAPLRSPLGSAVGSHASGNGRDPAVAVPAAGPPDSTGPAPADPVTGGPGTGEGAGRDPFAGCPDDHGLPQIDRAAKRAWLIERLTALAERPGGLEAVAARWPVGEDGRRILTFKETGEHTVGELEAIQAAITGAETAVRAPWPEREDPTDPANIVVANDDPRVTGLIGRGEALPGDLAARVRAELRAAKIPKLSTGRVTEAHLSAAEALVAAAETEHETRAKRLADALAVAAEHGVSEAALRTIPGVAGVGNLHGEGLATLDELVDAVALGVITERAGALVVDQPAMVLAMYGDDRRRVLAAGQAAAKARGLEPPRDSDAVLSDLVLVAALASV